ncbi:hypothetical protein CspeluHIS016_0900060 [Cutaneotrichosporon spelunceum]|uniref:Uncharacterized protein n=1 Tax=Cutaneotrichosporon spelunceum TaxID=1672016 RepID=A0AAD3TZK5_9TREE|nr:hypothetical protein CspeluHIS016_0900060 [Cutaneotrichosporon spelunceum]
MFNNTRATSRPRRARDSTAPRQSMFSSETPARNVRQRATMIPSPTREHNYEVADYRVLWSRDERHSVTAVGALPAEVARQVENADFILHTVAGQLDTSSGFALVSGPDSCMAWKYTKQASNTTVSVFPAPQPTRSHMATVPPALAAFYGSTEPGLILISATGEVRFWESMGLALHNVQRFQSLQLDLGLDFAEHLWKIDEATFIITTTASTAFRLSIVHEGGRLVPKATAFTRASGMSIFTRQSTAIFHDTAERNGIVAAAAAEGGCFLLGRSTLQKWNLGLDGSVRIAWEIDIRESIGSLLLNTDGAWSSGNMLLMLNDLVAVSPHKHAALVSYHRQDGASGDRKQAQHAIIVFENPDPRQFTVDNSVYLSYLAHSDPRMLDVPRLFIPRGSQTAFVRFSDTILMASLSSSPYEDAISLRDSGRNAFIGVAPSPPGHVAASVVAMASIGGIMSIEVHEGATQSRKMTSSASATARLKNKLEQAVFFGANRENPLTFDLPAGFQGDLPAATEEVSAEIVSNSATFMTPVSETRQSLMDRLAKLRELMLFIHRNGVLSLLPDSSRRRLSAHAEKVQSALELWDYQNRLMDRLNSRSPQSLLADSIQTLMSQLGDNDEDFVRAFFRRHVLDLDRLLDTVFATFKAAVDGQGPGTDSSAWVLEANRIFTIALRSSDTWRMDEMDLYAIDVNRVMVDLWTASDSLLNDMDSLYGLTHKVIQDRTRRIGTIVDEESGNATGSIALKQKEQVELKAQMTILADGLCENVADKLHVAENRASGKSEDSAEKREVLVLQQRWDELKPRVIRPLEAIGRVEEAYSLAEQFRDYSTLVYLCEKSGDDGRTQAYIERFGNDFTFELYQWYIDQRQYYELLAQDEVYGARLTAFFASHPHPELSWMHDIASKRYGAAAAALTVVDGETAELVEKQLITSIAKLAAVAEYKTSGGGPHVVGRLDDELDNIAAQRALADDMSDDPVPSELDKRPALKRVLENGVDALRAGEALSTEDLVDVLTLKAGHQGKDGALAIGRLQRDDTLPAGRQNVSLNSAWRRIYIADDWAALANTAGRSEEDLRMGLRHTWAYATLAALRDTTVMDKYLVSPASALATPTQAEVSARYPAFSGEDVAALMHDHEDEALVLRKLVEAGFEKQLQGVRQLVAADAEREDGDVSMGE